MKSIYARLTFIDDLLGTASADPEIHETFVASKAPDAQSIAEEVESIGVDGVVREKSTIFSRDKEGHVHIWGYQVKGQFKATCGLLRSVEKPGKDSDSLSDNESGEKKKKKSPAYQSGKLTNYLKKIDGLIHVYPRKIMLNLPEGCSVGSCQRPLRAKTAQGDRVALANSESVPEGTWCDIEIKMIDESHEPMVREWLDFGEFYGLGQWRNSGKGQFIWEELDADGNIIPKPEKKSKKSA